MPFFLNQQSNGTFKAWGETIKAKSDSFCSNIAIDSVSISSGAPSAKVKAVASPAAVNYYVYL